MNDLVTLTTDKDMRVKASKSRPLSNDSSAVRKFYMIYHSSYSFCNFIRYALRLPYGLLLISNISYANIGRVI